MQRNYKNFQKVVYLQPLDSISITKFILIMFRILVFTLLFLSSYTFLKSQNPIPIDTIESDGKKIVFYDNKTWEFLILTEAQIFNDSLFSSFEEHPIFKNNWVTTDKYAFLETRNKPIQEQNIKLVNSFDKFVMPVSGPLYGKFRRGHKGIDIGLKKGDTIRSVFGGRVRLAQYDRSGYGNLIIVRHFNGLETFYAHLSKINVKPGQWVNSGDLLGLGGSTGRSKGPHLHFETRYYDRPFDPLKIIDYEGKQLIADNLLVSNELFTGSINTKSNGSFNGSYGGSTDGEYHKIKKGETLGSIAKKYGTTVSNLKALNNMGSSTLIREGKSLKIK